MSTAARVGFVAASRRRSGGGAGAYFSAVTALSPTSHWKLDEGSGSTLTDAFGSKNLTVRGTPTTYGDSTGLTGVGNGINFGGTSYGIITSALTQITTNKFTVCGWWYLNSTPANFSEPLICASYSGGHTDPFYTFGLFKNSSTQWRVAIANSGSFTPNDTGVAFLGNGAWAHIALTYDGTNAVLYKDGSSIYTVGKTGNVQAMGSFAIGCIPALDSTANSPDFRASQVSYWHNTALTSGDISTLYAART